MSKFDKVFEAREEAIKEKPSPSNKISGGNPRPSKPKKEAQVVSDSNLDSDAGGSQISAAIPPETKQRGRPKAKRSDPNFIGFTTYIRKDTHLKVKIALLQEGKGREMSELVQELLAKWLKAI